jgi:hypothetical protein
MNSSDKSLMLDFTSPCERYTLTFEDNPAAAYAYLRCGDTIVGDVWLCNRDFTPEDPEWTRPPTGPFRNCELYTMKDGLMVEPIEHGDVLVDWNYEEAIPVAYIYIFEHLYGVIAPGEKPGISRYAAKTGPVGQFMEIED